MTVALEFYIRCLNLRDNLPIPCSFCVESNWGDRKVVTLTDAYRQPTFVAVRHWLLSDCEADQSLPAIQEKLVLRNEVFKDPFVIIPQHSILKYVGHCVPHSINTAWRPPTPDVFASYYDSFLNPDVHVFYKELWVWREFIKVYLPFMAVSTSVEPKEEISRLREIMMMILNTQPELWRKWQHWRKYMTVFDGLPGELAFHSEYGSSIFEFCN